MSAAAAELEPAVEDPAAELAVPSQPAASQQVRRRELMEDLKADHQIVVRSIRGHEIFVSCTCLKVPGKGRPGWTAIETRLCFPASELWDAWADWHLRRGGWG